MNKGAAIAWNDVNRFDGRFPSVSMQELEREVIRRIDKTAKSHCHQLGDGSMVFIEEIWQRGTKSNFSRPKTCQVFF